MAALSKTDANALNMDQGGCRVQDELNRVQGFWNQGEHGKAGAGIRLILELKRQLLPGDWVRLGNLARITGHSGLVVHILYQVVQRWEAMPVRERPSELNELWAKYAANCSMMGSPGEACRILQGLLKRHPRSVLVLECALWHHLSQYEYEHAEIVCRKLRDIEPSGRPQGNSALAELLIALRGRHVSASRFEVLFLGISKQPGTPAWLRNAACQLRAEKLLFLDGDADGALTQVRELEEKIQDHNSIGLSLMRNLISLSLDREPARNEAIMRRVEDAAREASDFYSLRCVDAYRAMILGDREAMVRQVFGNGFRGMLDLVLSRWKGSTDFPVFATWRVTSQGWRRVDPDGAPVLDLQTGRVEGARNSEEFRLSGLPLRAIQVLASDFVTPVRERSLFESLYPGEDFNSASSPMRLHAVLGRIRLWATSHGLPLEIEARQRSYRLSSAEGLCFRLRNPLLPREEGGPELPEEVLKAEKALRAVFGPRDSITSSDVQKVLNVSLRTSVYRLKGLCEAGRLRSSGKGRATRYWLAGGDGSING